jgi:peptide/nickel transport system permease protein
MRRYITKRIIYAIFVMWLVATTVFVGLRSIPGGPVVTMLGQKATPERVRELRHQLGLARPLWIQYTDYMTDFLTFDFGRSIMSGQQISELVISAAKPTLSIAVVGIVVGLSIAIPAGIISALYKDQYQDYIATISAFLGLSMPAFVVGIMLAVIFGVWLDLLPVFNYVPLKEGFIPWFKHIILPGIAVGVPYAAVIMRMTRSSLLEVLGSPYIKTAKAKGVQPRVRLYKHAIQNAMIPVVTVAGIQLALVLIGSVTVELVFGIQGIGRLLVDAILVLNYPVVQVVIVLIAFVLVFSNLIVDLIYTLIDPRIRYGDKKT